MSSNQRVIITNLDDDILDPERSLSGKSRIGNITIVRNTSHYMTQIQIIEGITTRSLAISRDANNYITSISESIICLDLTLIMVTRF